jgi:CBS domain-containing protein
VVDGQQRLVGIVSESDLMQRAETDTAEKHPWWKQIWLDNERLASAYLRSHGQHVIDVMTSPVVTATPSTPLQKIASLLKRHGIKRVVIVDGMKVVGIVSRSDFVRAFAASRPARASTQPSDDQIRDNLYAQLRGEGLASGGKVNIIVDHGNVALWAAVHSDAERRALCLAAESTEGVVSVSDHIVVGSIPAGC